MSHKGIDISVWQSNVNYSKLKEDNIDFAIIRCGYGKYNYQKDNMFEEHFQGLKNAGIKVGVYLYSYTTSVENSILEAKNCLEFIKDKEIDLPIFYDLEDKITKVLGKETITKCAIAFCEEIEKQGFKAGVYANLDWFTNYIDVNKLIEKDFKIWVAQWNSKFTGDFPINYWQYTSKGRINAIFGNVDLDYCYDDISKTGENVNNFVDNSNNLYEIEKTYTTQVDLNVRTGAGTNFRIKNYRELTENAKRHSYKQENAVLKKGTRVTCQDIMKIGKNIWIKIPSRLDSRFL